MPNLAAVILRGAAMLRNPTVLRSAAMLRDPVVLCSAAVPGDAAAFGDPALFGNAVLGCIAAVSAATDLYCGRVYNFITVPGLCLGILLAAQNAGAAGILDVLCAAGFTILILFPFYRAGGLGAGDIKLLAAISAFLPAQTYLCCFAGAFVIGAVLGVLRLLLSRGETHTMHFAVPVALSVLLHLAGLY